MATPPITQPGTTSQEGLLLDYLHRLESHKAGRRAVHIHLSKLEPHNRRDHHVRMAVDTFDLMVKMQDGQIFTLKNADLFSGRKDKKGDQDHEHDEVHAIINHSPQDSLLNFAEMTTGLSIALVLRNHDAANELAEALKVAATATSS